MSQISRSEGFICQLILSAGFGTRMGPIGKALPKVLWPIFEEALLGIQIEYVNELKIIF